MEGVAMSDSTKERTTITVEATPFTQIPNWILDEVISAQAIRLYVILRRQGHNERHTSFYSRRKIADAMQCSPATIDRAKQELIDCGAICQINRKSKDGDWTSNMYHVHGNKNLNCKYLLKSDETYPASDDTYTASDETGLLTGDELTKNQLELRTKELNTRTSFDVDVHHACNLLAHLIEGNGSKRPVVTDKWLADMERLHRIDGRSWDQIAKAIMWCQDDDFWKANIMSPAKLRKQYDQLRLAAQRTQKQSPASGWLGILNRVREQEPLELER
jgi:hypothetical protein